MARIARTRAQQNKAQAAPVATCTHCSRKCRFSPSYRRSPWWIAQRCHRTHVPTDAVVVEEEHKGTSFFLILSGTVAVTDHLPDMMGLGAGASGEMSLLFGSPRNATNPRGGGDGPGRNRPRHLQRFDGPYPQLHRKVREVARAASWKSKPSPDGPGTGRRPLEASQRWRVGLRNGGL